MAPIHSIKNQYLGINAHLHSFWQAEHKWNRFHNAQITHLWEALQVQLRPIGYVAEIDESVQIRRVGDDLRQPRSDILIRDTRTQRNPQPTFAGGLDVQTLPLVEFIADEEDIEHPYSAIRIFERDADEPVAWIKLLSPTNKGTTKDAFIYLPKRQTMLENGLVFVEIDYLHETPPTSTRLADYASGELDAYPYSIAVIDPRPAYQQGQVALRQFDVDTPIPAMMIPLNADDAINFDFGSPYQTLFERAFYGDQVNYAQLPLNFDRYSPADQQRIANRMLVVIEAARRGDDLEVPPQPLENLITLDEALKRIEELS